MKYGSIAYEIPWGMTADEMGNLHAYIKPENIQ